MNAREMEAIIEAILFTIGESVEVSRIAKVIEQDVRTTKKLIKNLMDRYEEEGRGIHIIELEDSYDGDLIHHCIQAANHEDGD